MRRKIKPNLGKKWLMNKTQNSKMKKTDKWKKKNKKVRKSLMV
jgi:hypothetical protein